jgi:hypothetical protein
MRIEIYEDRLPVAFERLAKVNEKAAKLDAKPAALRVVEIVEREVKKNYGGITRVVVETKAIVEVDVSPVKFEGWTFAAKLTPISDGVNVVDRVPGFELPIDKRYRSTGMFCDHCKTERNRKETFLVYHEDGNVLQVGRTCLKDFLGQKSAAQAILELNWIDSLVSAFSEDEDNWPRGEALQHTDLTLEMAACVIRQIGFLSKGKAIEGETVPTSDHIFEAYIGGPRKEPPLYQFKDITDADIETAKAAKAWAFDQDSARDYIHNLQAILSLEESPLHRIGLITSAVGMYVRSISAEKEKASLPVSNWVGEEKERIEFGDVTVIFTILREGDFGVTNILKFRTAEGNVLTWFASRDQRLEVGDSLADFVGTVKKHDQYRDEKATIITRCKYSEAIGKE